MSSNVSDFRNPTPDDLGGIPLIADCPEDTTVRPRRAYVKVPATLPDPHTIPTLDDLNGIPACFDENDALLPGERRNASDGPSEG